MAKDNRGEPDEAVRTARILADAKRQAVKSKANLKRQEDNNDQRVVRGIAKRAMARAERKLPVSKKQPPVDFRLMSLDKLQELAAQMLRAEKYDWRANARKSQIYPEGAKIWLMLCGRGFGKTRAAVEEIRNVCKKPGAKVCMIAKDHKALREVCLEGKSGLIACIPPEEIKKVHKGLGDIKVELVNGSVIIGYGLPVDEVVPTPSGWCRMGDLRAGDTVFDESGQPCSVVAAHAPYEPKRMYRLIFSDSSVVDADGEHLWVTVEHKDFEARAKRLGQTDWSHSWPTENKTKNTAELAATVLRSHASRIVRNHRIPNARALVLPQADLPLDPYVLGYWLGDGSVNDARIACHPDDQSSLIEQAVRFGPHVTAAKPFYVSLRGLRPALRELGVLSTKFVPDIYLRASPEQRLALLQGLMDSDGSTGGQGVTFSNTRRCLIDAVYELACSLGEKPTVRPTKASKSYGENCLPGWRVTWTPTRQNPFRLPRKADRVTVRESLQQRYRSLVSCEPIPTTTVRCITVDSPNAMYLAGRSMIPTHNTAMEPDAVRGTAHDLIWGDEFAAWPKNRAQDMLDQALMTMRESEHGVRCILSTTPKRIPHVVEMVKLALDPTEGIVVTRGSSRENTALTEEWFRIMERKYGGTRLGRQELDGELVLDVENALWTGRMMDEARWPEDEDLPAFSGVITGVDPSGSKDGDATGIVTVGWVSKTKQLFVLDNPTTKGEPMVRYSAACMSAFRWNSTEIWYESAYGGDNAAFGIEQAWKHLQNEGLIPEDRRCPRIQKSTIKGDKAARAMPVVALYEQQVKKPEFRNIWHVQPTETNNIASLEDQMVSWETTDKKSPNDIDAAVHACRAIMRRLGMEAHVGSFANPLNKRRINSGGYDPFGGR